MTREEEINNASYSYWANNYANIEFIDEEEKELHTQDIQDSFINGAEWADQHPHWISVEDGLLPKKSEYDDLSNNVLATDGKEIYESVYNHDFEDWFTYDMWGLDNITHWCYLPQLPVLSNSGKTGKDLKGDEE